MRRIHLILPGILLGMILLATTGCQSDRPGFDSVIVTKNYVHSRMLAELIQSKNRQPIILLPTGEENDRIYAMDSFGRAKALPAKQFLPVVEQLSPKAVIFLGNEKYASPEFQKEIVGLYPVVVIANSKFDKVAAGAGAVMRLNDLEDQYERLSARISSRGQIKPPPTSLWDDLQVPGEDDSDEGSSTIPPPLPAGGKK